MSLHQEIEASFAGKEPSFIAKASPRPMLNLNHKRPSSPAAFLSPSISSFLPNTIPPPYQTLDPPTIKHFSPLSIHTSITLPISPFSFLQLTLTIAQLSAVSFGLSNKPTYTLLPSLSHLVLTSALILPVHHLMR